ncbi:ATP phosphoribosyltransferase regulatory subunit [Sulfobacillus thermosulfidooxidans]|uniref:Histidyl-tRNA synthetase n=2 Tax=Sulfobacillus thermosulfidooxidans TaxID=28034 RepID=A0A1W1W7R7_SULTA|nr:ATP phosphoribosyltransferase regulatory subunit [Sulfobacillus thermosulfidooxidans]OLZ10553.1 hypothetical protein BFX05_01600 [Sulfobacillus thermosulfidooxidans]OLZ15241.1 hypothetical protein BFX06_04695 [Sulfobacillus thermosulfidooxidans]OLZ22230.1 hypothetical protein BFX07_10215 [Sulfobacillus thermosulfidooxidans]PSR23075.1 MAG: hypothetical protein C7B47_16155 [Sulfobacillus thermosulfidooxidans]SMC02324.1 Histidyl-tRNA synthetase [Sulfobacillus thermosulfidooxidans DSM 9293]
MDEWLNQNRREYELMMMVINQFLAQGFYPVPTAPAQAGHYREDHTQSILELLSSFPESHIQFPLQVFSLGPVYDPGYGRWAETIDVEILGAGGPQHELLALELIMRLITTWPGLASRTLMVMGHLGLLNQVLTRESVPDVIVTQIRQALRSGNLVTAESLMTHTTPKSRRLLLSKPYKEFLDNLRKTLPEADFDHLSRLEQVVHQHVETRWDLSLTGNWPYYTDLVFSLYLKDVGQPVLNGGRFVQEINGRSWQGVGFTLYLDPLYHAVGQEMESLMS